MKYEYRFYPNGTTVDLDALESWHIWVDNGNTLIPGVLDHHQSTQYSCTVQIIANQPQLLDSIHSNSDDNIVFFTHKYPDTDALFSIYIIQYYLEHNRQFPKHMDDIIDYVTKVDEGRIEIDTSNKNCFESIYSIFSFLYEVEVDMTKCTQKALTVIEYVLKLLDKTPSLDLFTTSVKLPSCRPEIKLAKEDYIHYQEDFTLGRCYETYCTLPLENMYISKGKVRALIWKEAPTCSFNRIYARNEGYVLTVVPSKQKEFKSNTISVSCSRTIISLNPQARDQSGMAYSLLPVARLLETFEQEREADILHNSSNVKRDHSAPRGYQHQEDSIFIKRPFSETSDPWYINAEENLIASPHSGSLLSVEDIICVVCSFGDCTIRSSKTKVIVPFTYEQKIEKDLDRYLRSIGIKMDGHKNFPYVDSSKRYLNELLEEFILDDTNFSYYQIKTDVREMECLLFSYGVGFFFYNVNRDYVKQSRSSYTEIEEINESRFSLDHNIHNNELQFLGIQYPKLRFINPHFYTSVCLAPENIKISNKPIENFAKRLSTIDGSSSDRCITMEPTYRQALALSRVGCAYVSSVTIQDDLEKRYENEWFFLYLLVLQQRYMLMDCKRQLIAIKLTAGSKVKDLKEMLIAFCSNGLFSSAVEDELGDHYYRVLMEDVFYISSLKEEVLTQVEQLDHYHEGRLNETLNKISVWILPFMVISTILQCSIITMNPLISISDSGFPFRVTSSLQAWCSWGFIFLIIVIAFLILHLSRRRKK